MPQYDAGGRKVTIQPVDRSFFFYRVQGVSVNISAKVSLITCTINLIGLAGSQWATASNRNHSSLEILGPGYWGINVPRAYYEVGFECRIDADGKSYTFRGEMLYGSGGIPDIRSHQ